MRIARVLLPVICFGALACGKQESVPLAESQSASRDTASAISPMPAQSADPILMATEKGIGLVTVGMTNAEVSTALGTDVKGSANRERGSCDQVNIMIKSQKVLLMFVDGQVARFDVVTRGIATREGAQVGDSESRIDSLYIERVQTTPHKYTDGHYMTVTPSMPSDSGYRMIFETDGKQVTRYRAGKLPEVEWVEGCS